MCDPRVCRALLFRCMIVRLCWHFSNFSWLCKMFLQTFLHLANQFCNLKVIPKLGCDFAAISKLGDHFAEKWHVHRPFLKLGAFSQQGVDFVEEGNSRNPFLSLKVISQLKGDFAAVSQLQNEENCAAKWHSCAKKWFRSCETPFQMASQLRNSRSALHTRL